MSAFDQAFIDTFWSQVDKTGGEDACWNWEGRAKANGIGVVRLPHRQEQAHRVAFMLAGGAIQPAYHVARRCGNPRCCNPAHLFAATQAEVARAARERKRRSEAE